MNDGAGLNAPVMLLTFLSSLGLSSITNLLASVFSAVLIGLVGLAAQKMLQGWIAERNNYWRQQAKKFAEEKRQLEQQLKEQAPDAVQLSTGSD